MQITLEGDIRDKGFRFSVVHTAFSLNLNGYVEYSTCGVFIEVEGESANLDQFVDWLRNGPFSAWIDNIDLCMSEFKNHKTFDLRHGNEEYKSQKISLWSSVKTLCERCVKKITQS
jgi:hydrogenase maturation protein HypF